MNKDIHNTKKFEMQRIEQFRKMRHDKFKELDVDFFKALENNDWEKIELIKQHKQKLRDINNYIFPEFDDPRAILDHIPDFLI